MITDSQLLKYISRHKCSDLRLVSFIFVTHHVTLNSLNAACIRLERKQCFRYMYHFLFHTCLGISHKMLISGDTLMNMKTENRTLEKQIRAQPKGPEKILA